jgi:hypothetical protein
MKVKLFKFDVNCPGEKTKSQEKKNKKKYIFTKILFRCVIFLSQCFVIQPQCVK